MLFLCNGTGSLQGLYWIIFSKSIINTNIGSKYSFKSSFYSLGKRQQQLLTPFIICLNSFWNPCKIILIDKLSVVTKYLIEESVEERIGEGGGHPYQMTTRVNQPVGSVRPGDRVKHSYWLWSITIQSSDWLGLWCYFLP